MVPVYNAAPFLDRTLFSIRQQTYQNWELLLIDDGSTDDSVRLLEQWKQEQAQAGQKNRICILKNGQNKGAAFSRNQGIRAARGRYLVYLDADDYWEAEKLEKQYCFMREKNCAFSFTGYEFANREGTRNGRVVHVPQCLTYREALSNTIISTITVMFDREKLSKELLLMPEDCQREDTATWWKILKTGVLAYGLDEALSVYCRHRGSHSSNKLRAVFGTYRMYRKQERLGILEAMRYMIPYVLGAVRRRTGRD